MKVTYVADLEISVVLKIEFGSTDALEIMRVIKSIDYKITEAADYQLVKNMIDGIGSYSIDFVIQIRNEIEDDFNPEDALEDRDYDDLEREDEVYDITINHYTNLVEKQFNKKYKNIEIHVQSVDFDLEAP